MRSNIHEKLVIPRQDYLFYKTLYTYLHGTLNVKADVTRHHPLAEALLRKYRRQDEGKFSSFSSKKPRIVLDTSSSSLEKNPSIEQIHAAVEGCDKCPLSKKRKNFVSFGLSHSTPVMVLLDQPSYYDETQRTLGAQDKCGQLLRKILGSLEISFEKVYLTAVMKCASISELPYNLEPMKPCRHYLNAEIKRIEPKFLLGFGEITYRYLFEPEKNDFSRKVAGKRLSYEGRPIVFTHHPKELLMDFTLKKETWQHLSPYQQELQGLFQSD